MPTENCYFILSILCLQEPLNIMLSCFSFTMKDPLIFFSLIWELNRAVKNHAAVPLLTIAHKCHGQIGTCLNSERPSEHEAPSCNH